jgi:hypothetical protein
VDWTIIVVLNWSAPIMIFNHVSMGFQFKQQPAYYSNTVQIINLYPNIIKKELFTCLTFLYIVGTLFALSINLGRRSKYLCWAIYLIYFIIIYFLIITERNIFYLNKDGSLNYSTTTAELRFTNGI